MTPLSIVRFRRLTLAFITLLFAGLAFSSVASGDGLGMVKTKYRAEVSGSWVHTWQTRIGDYPDPETPWTDGRGKVRSDFTTKRPWKFVAVRYVNPPPELGDMPPFSMGATIGNSLASVNSAAAKVSVNYVADCGGELGECDGDEKSGTETSDRSCRKPNSKMPLEFDFDADGNDPMMEVQFGEHRTMHKFCGPGFFYKASIDRLPLDIRIPRGLDRIKNLKRGGTYSWKGKFEEGWIGDNADEQGPRYLKKCPKLGGKGTRHCWKTTVKFKVKRVK